MKLKIATLILLFFNMSWAQMLISNTTPQTHVPKNKHWD
jgi:hypothetical protein